MNNKRSARVVRGSLGALLFSGVIVVLCSGVQHEQAQKVLAPKDAVGFGGDAYQSRNLSFADRVAYQRAIEDVYWRHRIWPKERRVPKPSLDAVMSQAQLERKVEDYLRKSQTLEDHWQRPARNASHPPAAMQQLRAGNDAVGPITAEQLQTEMERMASHTRQPEILQELFEALGNDPFIIAECLARPIVTERLITDFAAVAEPSLSASRTGVPPAQRKSSAADTAASTENRIRVMANVAYHLPVIGIPLGGCTGNVWIDTNEDNPLSPRNRHTAVWTGTEMIVWGGYGYTNTGARYDTVTDNWTATTLTNAPEARTDHTAVWTGSEMIVWGGFHDFPATWLNTGGRYDPINDSWTATSTNGAPEARSRHTAVWSGSEMIVWGGWYDFPSTYLNTGGRYNPINDSWTATSTTGAPDARRRHTAVWSDSQGEMLVWGGLDINGTSLNTGGRYNPSTDNWIATSTADAPLGRFTHQAVWTGSEMIVWGGCSGNDVQGCSNYLDTGGRYDPSTDSWTATSTAHVPDVRAGFTAIWSGSEMIVWGGDVRGVSMNTGGRYNPITDTWNPTSLFGAPRARYWHSAIWTGTEMIVWGGSVIENLEIKTGGRYCPQADIYPIRRRHDPRARPFPVPRPP